MGNLRIENVQQLPIKNSKKVTQKGPTGFGEIIKGAINSVNGLDREANRSIVDLLQGKTDIPETMIALQRADISMRLFLTIRNKVLEAYREIMHMQF
ncbi:MAG: flagellar hook-basal body complex protein FliE [Deltaproteobacteria bacterium]|nr:flagellar hook-basal body complex protein FliE [Deltaproteobacteria bacterium]MBW2106717.1 flagellar hook-basal body complex protein FliE [Deltaproteobacteria bacterium]